jgi:hypothetical protein
MAKSAGEAHSGAGIAGGTMPCSGSQESGVQSRGKEELISAQERLAFSVQRGIENRLPIVYLASYLIYFVTA